jgi:arsenite methyltransferase
MVQKVDPKEILSAVRAFYGRKARKRNQACCGPESRCRCSPAGNYPDEELAGLPGNLADVSLGCGNPVSEIDIRLGDTVLDLGSGGGLDCFLAARKTGSTGRVIGMDMTPEMIDRARANAAKAGVSNVEFRLGQIESMPAADGEADVVISNCVINLSPDKPAVFREMFRVLRRGGRIAVSDIVTRGPMSPLVARSLDSWSGCVAGALDMAEYRRGLEAAGFTEVSIAPSGVYSHASAGEKSDGMPFSALITARRR